MNRRKSLTHTGISVLTVMGISGLLNSLARSGKHPDRPKSKSPKHDSVIDYNSGPYGGQISGKP